MGSRFSREDGAVQVILLGLENAGKSSILGRLTYDRFLEQIPTSGFNHGKFRLQRGPGRGHKFSVWDASGNEAARSAWNTYFRSADVILFVVDSADTHKFHKAKELLHSTVSAADFPKNAIVMVLANKQDLIEAKQPEDLFMTLRIKRLKRVCIRGCSAKNGDGLDDIFTHLYLLLDHGRKLRRSRTLQVL